MIATRNVFMEEKTLVVYQERIEKGRGRIGKVLWKNPKIYGHIWYES